MDSLSPSTVLVVDDHEASQQLTLQTLEAQGYRVLLAGGVEQAAELFLQQPPDLLLIDTKAPGLAGVSICERLRALPGGTSTPVIFLTASHDLGFFDLAQQAGADDFLLKPVGAAELAMRVRTLVRMRQLARELDEHFQTVRAQRDALMRLQLQKEQLTNFLVHDLKNPINTIGLHTALLLRARGLPADLRESVDSIRTETRRLTRLVLNLLDLSKGEEGQLTPQLAPCDINALCQEVCELHRALSSERGLRIEARTALGAPVLPADADLLRRILENLIDNALRYAPPESAITISTEAAGDDHVLLKVADQGPGIPAPMREQIFEKYVQLSPDEASSRTGRGLGLQFCRMAAEAHRGAIWVDPTTPGATFCVKLPRG